MRLGLAVLFFGLFLTPAQEPQPSTESQYQLGRAYLKGKGVKKDPAAAEYWFRKAAERGNRRAQSALEELEQRRTWKDSGAGLSPLALCPTLGTVPYCTGSPR